VHSPPPAERPWPTLPGTPALNRGTVRRVSSEAIDDQWVARRWTDPRSRVLLVGSRGEVSTSSGGVLLVAPGDVAPGATPLALGVDDDDVAYFAAVVDPPPEPTATLRELGVALGDRDVGLAVQAVGLANWHRGYRYSPRTGQPMRARAGGHVLYEPDTGVEHHPRTDPAVIMLVMDEHDRALLGHQVSWPDGRYSTLAGFVETGETPEHAVVREVAEETGVQVHDLHYAGSQPWPFPASLMLGYYARARGVTPRPDGREIGSANWFTTAELASAVAQETVRLPPRLSIARALIEGWYGGPLGEDSSWG